MPDIVDTVPPDSLDYICFFSQFRCHNSVCWFEVRLLWRIYISDIQCPTQYDSAGNARKLSKVGCVVGRTVRQVILQVLMIV